MLTFLCGVINSEKPSATAESSYISVLEVGVTNSKLCKNSCPQISNPQLILGFSHFQDRSEDRGYRQAIITQRFRSKHVIAFGNRHSLIILLHDGGGGLGLPFSACGLVTSFVVSCIFSVSRKHNQTE